MTISLPAPVAQVKEAFDALSVADKALFEEAIHGEHEGTDAAVPWPDAELERRINRVNDGAERLIPLEEARRTLKGRLIAR